MSQSKRGAVNVHLVVTEPSINDALRRIREARGWTQAELAKRVGVSPRAIARTESKKANLRLLTVDRSLRAMGYMLDLEKPVDVR